MKLAFTTTAMNRPSVVAATYGSFTKYLTGVDFKNSTLYINIDPLPSGRGRKAVVKIARTFFGNVIPRYPKKANFAAAVNWLWSQPDDDYIFHLEDDWAMLESVDINTLLAIFDKRPAMLQVVLRAYWYKYAKFCLSPSIIKRELYKHVGGSLDESINPEVQLRGQIVNMHKKVAAYPHRVIIKDIGRKWLRTLAYRKPRRKSEFTSWVKI